MCQRYAFATLDSIKPGIAQEELGLDYERVAGTTILIETLHKH